MGGEFFDLSPLEDFYNDLNRLAVIAMINDFELTDLDFDIFFTTEDKDIAIHIIKSLPR